MEFRKATINDKEQVLEICKTIWEGSDYIPNIYEKWVNAEQGEFTMLLEDGKIVGMAKFTLLDPGIGWLEGLRVAPEARSRGYAREVTRYYIEKGRELGLDRLQLSTYYENFASIHVTESYGFQRIAYFYYADKELDPAAVQADQAVLQLTLDSPDYSTVVKQISEAPHHLEQRGFAGYGWLFKELTAEEIKEATSRGDVYYLKEDGVVTGALVRQRDYLKDKVYYTVAVVGEDAVIDRLLAWAEWDAVENGFTMIAAMVPENEPMKELYWNRGYKHWNDMREVNVYIYELLLKGDK